MDNKHAFSFVTMKLFSPRSNPLNINTNQITKVIWMQQRSECVITRNPQGVCDSKTDPYRLMFALQLIIMHATATVVRTYGLRTLPICDWVLSLKSSHRFETSFALWFLWYEEVCFYFLIILNTLCICVMAVHYKWNLRFSL